MLQRKEEVLVKRQVDERRALPKRIRAERKARDMMFRESLRISTNLDPDGERDKLKKARTIENIIRTQVEITCCKNRFCCSSKSKRKSVT